MTRLTTCPDAETVARRAAAHTIEVIAHATEQHAAQISATHGYDAVFMISSGLFAAGAVMGALLFPSKARLTEMRAAAAGTAGGQGQPESTQEPVGAHL